MEKVIVSFVKNTFEEAKEELENFNLNVVEFYEEFLIAEGKIEDIVLYTYKTQIALNVMLFFKKIVLDEDENITAEGKNFVLKNSFKVKKVLGEKYYELVLGKYFSKILNLEVDYKFPENIIGFVKEKNTFFTGIFLYNKELYKREYKVYSIPNSLNSNIAASILYFSKVKDDLLVLRCGDGILPIEYYFKITNTSVRKYEKEYFNFSFLKNNFGIEESFLEEKNNAVNVKIYCFDDSTNYLQRAKQNARLADAEKNIIFSKTDLELLILKFNKNINNVIVRHPFLSKHFTENKYNKYTKILLEELKNVLKEKGLLTIITNEEEEIKKTINNTNFKILKHKKIFRGDLTLNLFLLRND